MKNSLVQKQAREISAIRSQTAQVQERMGVDGLLGVCAAAPSEGAAGEPAASKARTTRAAPGRERGGEVSFSRVRGSKKERWKYLFLSLPRQPSLSADSLSRVSCLPDETAAFVSPG